MFICTWTFHSSLYTLYLARAMKWLRESAKESRPLTGKFGGLLSLYIYNINKHRHTQNVDTMNIQNAMHNTVVGSVISVLSRQCRPNKPKHIKSTKQIEINDRTRHISPVEKKTGQTDKKKTELRVRRREIITQSCIVTRCVHILCVCIWFLEKMRE